METQKLVKQLIIAKNDNTVMLAVLDFFKPLIESYARKLFFLEKEDAQQEIIIAIIEAIYSITKYENDAKCITYIHNAVKFKFSYLCKKNFKSPPIDETSETELYVRPYFEKYSDIEMFYDMEKYIPSENKITDISSLCGVDKDGKVLCVLTYYHNDERPEKTVKLDFGKEGKYEIYMLDEEHSNDLVNVTDDLTFNISNYTSILIKEI